MSMYIMYCIFFSFVLLCGNKMSKIQGNASILVSVYLVSQNNFFSLSEHACMCVCVCVCVCLCACACVCVCNDNIDAEK